MLLCLAKSAFFVCILCQVVHYACEPWGVGIGEGQEQDVRFAVGMYQSQDGQCVKRS